MGKSIREKIAEYNPDALLIDGYKEIEDFDEAIIGIGGQHGSKSVVIYSKEACINILAKIFSQEDDCEDPYLDAIEYFDYNIGGAYVGENTPIFLEEINCDCI